jgi:hypothetical protein
MLTVRSFNKRVIASRPVAATRPLYLDDLSTHIGEDHSAEGSSNNVSSVQYPKALQREGQFLAIGGHITSCWSKGSKYCP